MIYKTREAFWTNTSSKLKIEVTNGKYSNILAVEPDEKTFKKLLQNCSAYKNFEAVHGAVSSLDGFVEFTNSAGRQSTIGNGTEIPSYTIQTLSKKFVPTYIKIDAEGAEIDILTGGKKIISEFKPKMKIATYHKNSDIFAKETGEEEQRTPLHTTLESQRWN